MQNYIGKINSPFKKNQSIDFAQLTILDEHIEVDFSCNIRDYSSIKVIYGVFNGLGKVALINCKISGMSSGAASSMKKYSAEFLFHGEFLKNPALLNFDKVIAEVPGLLEWTNIRSVKNELLSNNKLSIKKVNYKKLHESNKFSISLFPFNLINSRSDKVTISENL